MLNCGYSEAQLLLLMAAPTTYGHTSNCCHSSYHHYCHHHITNIMTQDHKTPRAKYLHFSSDAAQSLHKFLHI